MNVRAVVSFGLALVWVSFAAGQQQALTLEQALERARRQGPTVLAARDRIEEARGRLKGASVLFRDNPVIDTAAGPRTGGSTDAEFGISQTFELGGRRGARIAGARADVDRETAASEDVLRRLLRDTASSFLQALAADERATLARSASDVANDFLRSMERRYELGDVPILEVNLARTAAARARSQLLTAEADRQSALGELRILLGMRADEPFAIAGDLRARGRYQFEELVSVALQRPDLRAIAAELRQAEAEVRLGRTFRLPDLGLGFRYEREEGDSVTAGTLSFTLPVFSRGQEVEAVGAARANRLRRELEAVRRSVAVEVQAALASYERKLEAAEELARSAIPSLDENETLARRSFEEGEVGLLDLLLIRRDSFEIRNAYVDRLLEAALAEFELQARAGVLR